MEWSAEASQPPKGVNPHSKIFKPQFLELGELPTCNFLHERRGPCPLPIKGVSRDSVFKKNIQLPRSEISVRGV